MIVVDTNVIAYLMLPGEHAQRAESLFKRDPEWAAPPLWRSEFRNVLATYMSRKDMTFEQARRFQQEAEDLMAGNEHDAGSDHVLELARDSSCTAYDCEFVALAIALGVPMVTVDKKILKAFPQHAQALPAR